MTSTDFRGESSEDLPRVTRESDHYDGFKREVREWWLGSRFQAAAGEKRFVEVSITATCTKGLGKWGAPDVTLVSRTDYECFWEPDFEVVTFEVKSGMTQLTIDSAYEAVAHKRVGTKAFLVVIDTDAPTLTDAMRQNSDNERSHVRSTAARFRDAIKILRANGVGLVVARDGSDRLTWEEWLRADRSPPNARWINRLLMSGFQGASEQARLRTLLLKN